MLPIQTILFPTDLSEYAERLFRLARYLARDYQARLIVLHVTPPPLGVWAEGVFVAPPEIDREQLLAQLKQQYQPPDLSVPVEHVLEEGEPVAEILRTAREIPCDVIIMGTHGRKGLSRFVMGSVAEKVVREAPCAVVTVKLPAKPAQVEATGHAPGAAKAVTAGR